MKTIVKTSTVRAMRVSAEIRAAAEAMLKDGETLSSFVLEAIKLNIQRRATLQKFIARRSGQYVSVDEVLAGLDRTLARTSKASKRK